jgi:hypothetical protein
MNITGLKNKIDRLARQSPDFISRVAPHAVAVVAANLFKENFQNEGFEGDKWSEVNRRKDYYVRQTDGKKMKNYAKGAARLRPIITGETGDLGRSVEPDTARFTGVNAVVTAKYYGKFHNEGEGHLPKRHNSILSMKIVIFSSINLIHKLNERR